MSSPARPFIYLIILAFILIQPASSLGQSGDQKPMAAGSVSGRVSVGGKPVAGIAVAAIAGDTINRRDSAARAVTDSEGNYRISGLLAGPYQIWAVTPGLIAEQQPNPSYVPYGSLRNILLSPNEDVANVDLKLISGCVITGRVTTVEDKPVVEERVLLELLDESGNPRFGVPRSFSDQVSRTDDRGIYRIYGLPPGRYKISVGYDPNDGFRGSPYPRTYYSEPGEPSKAAIVELKEGGEATHIDIKVDAPTKFFTVSGRVTDATTGRPIAGVGFMIAAVQKDQQRSPGFIGLTTDDGGEFKFEGLRPGRYSVSATSEHIGGNFYGDPVYFEIVDRDVTGIHLKAIPGLSLSGIVMADGIATRDLLALLPDLRTYARSESAAKSQGSGGGSAAVAPDGSFQINGLRPGRVTIDVFTRSGGGARPTVARVEHEGINIGQGFELQQSTSGVVVALNYGTGSVRGVVRFAGGVGRPADSRIIVSVKREGSRDGTSAETDARGNFAIRNLAPGTYEVTLQIFSPLRDRSQRQPEPQKQLVNVTNGAESELAFLVDLSKSP